MRKLFVLSLISLLFILDTKADDNTGADANSGEDNASNTEEVIDVPLDFIKNNSEPVERHYTDEYLQCVKNNGVGDVSRGQFDTDEGILTCICAPDGNFFCPDLTEEDSFIKFAEGNEGATDYLTKCRNIFNKDGKPFRINDGLCFCTETRSFQCYSRYHGVDNLGIDSDDVDVPTILDIWDDINSSAEE
ncbi:hypothetical protein BB561_003963 [Smittium simulii]|uniref:Cyanovirin-N domain-containing protein n=1 Tax=Smittium simulii TaxID=133385 RepID=A0A2T9YIQ8_9FUNG|nr:hypothetical protein BB561_003963 [Smittium simulii]